MIKFFRQFFFLINFLVALYSLLVFQLSYSADIKHWLAGFLMLSVPVVFILNGFFIGFYIVSRSWKFLLSLLILVVGYPLLQRTFNYSQKVEIAKENQFSVLSYNVMYMDYGSHQEGSGNDSSEKLAMAVDSIQAGIKCFQEFYSSSKIKSLDLISILQKNNPHFTFMHKKVLDKSPNGPLGLAIFSKYPIIDTEEIYWSTNNNGILRADVVIGDDTLRVFNTQLKSMGIRVQKVIEADENKRAEQTKNIISLLKKGFEDRSLQVTKLEDLINASPYPSIVCGDFNELPYGYSYGRVRKLLLNSFEESGNGFGFTYHKILGFLRIDNQFFDGANIKINSFRTFKEIPYSDHYGIKGTYEFN